MSDQLKELQEQYAAQKSRASELSRDLGETRKEIKSWQDKAARLDEVEAELAASQDALSGALARVAQLEAAAEKAAVNSSRDAKRAAAFDQIRAALLETK